MTLKVKIRKIIENSNPLKAVCSITIDDTFVVHGVKLIELEKRRFISMPSEQYKDSEGNEQFRDICHPVTSEARKAMEEAVIKAYDAMIIAEKNKDINEKDNADKE